EVAQRIKRGQIDGAASGGVLCPEASPSLFVEWLPGLFQNRDEAIFVSQQLRQTFESEALANGYQLMTTTGIGPIIILSRKPVRDLADLRATRLWLWDIGPFAKIAAEIARSMNMQIVTTGINEAGHAYDEGKIDGFLAVPSAALAYQWSTQAHFV